MHLIADESREIGCNVVHLVLKVLLQLLAVVGELNDARGKLLNVNHIERADVGAHRVLGSLKHLLGLISAANNLFDRR